MEVSGRRPRQQSSAQQAGAVSGKRATESSTQPRKADSEEETPVCKIRERNGQKKEVVRYCVECSDHLYDSGYSSHLGQKPLSDSPLLDNSRMPRKHFQARHLCEAHLDGMLEYKHHNCRHCINLYHKSCQEDDLISNPCRNGECCSEFKSLEKELRDIEHKINEHKMCAKHNLTEIVVNRTKVRHEINYFKKKLYQFVDRLVDDMFEDVDDIADTDKDTIDTVSRDCEAISNEAQDIIKDLNVKKTSQEKTQLFISMKSLQKAKQTLANKLKLLDAQNKIRTYNFERENSLQNTMTSVQKLGHLLLEGEADVQLARANGGDVVNPAIKTPAYPVVSGVSDVVQRPTKTHTRAVANKTETIAACAVANKTETIAARAVANKTETIAARAVANKTETIAARAVANKTETIAVKSQSDTRDCYISGMALMDTDNMVLIDCNNKSVKMVSLRIKAVTHRAYLPHFPYEVIKVSKDTVAVSFPGTHVIQLVSVSPSGFLSLGRQIQIQEGCSGRIQYIDREGGRMIVGLLGTPAKVQIIDMFGTVLKELRSDSIGTQLFRNPCHTTVKNASIAYVSDDEMDTVTAMTLDGRVVFRYRDDQLKAPAGLAVGEEGMVYVCGRDSHNVHMVSSKGKKVKILVDDKDGVKYPSSIAYNSTNHKLYVGMDNINNVHVFTLTT